jgi:hypothetical protein
MREQMVTAEEIASEEFDLDSLVDSDEQQLEASSETNAPGVSKSDDPAPFVFKSGDEEYNQEQVEDAIHAFKNKNDWTKSNTTKAQELKEQRRLIEPILQEFVPKLKNDPELRTALDDLWQDMTGSDKGISEALLVESLDSIPNPFQEDIASLTQERDSLQEQYVKLQSDIALEKEITALTAKYPLSERQLDTLAEDLLKRYDETGTWMTLEDVLRLDRPQWANPNQAISTNNGTRASTAPVTTEIPKSYKDVPADRYADLMQ